MKTANRLPTPAELAVFVREIGLCNRHEMKLEDVYGHDLPYIERSRFFSRAIEAWENWEYQINLASLNWRESLAAGAKSMELIPLAECMKLLSVRDERTIKGWFERLEMSPATARTWQDLVRDGVPRCFVEPLREERDGISRRRAAKGGRAAAEKRIKKFK